jgi:hypothetical protein
MKGKWLLIFLLILFISCGKNENKSEEPMIGKTAILPENKEVQPKTEKPAIAPVKKEEQQQIEKPVINPVRQRIAQYPFTKGIYISAWMAATKQFPTLLDSAAAAGLNTVVFDLKNENGDIFFAFPEEINLKKHLNPFINIEKIVNDLHARNFRAATRLVMFHDQHVAQHMTQWRPKKKDGTPWRERQNGEISWLDSSHPDVQNRLLRMIELVAQSGVDEIQLDYVRFPTQGNLDDVTFHFEAIEKKKAEQDSTYVMKTKIDVVKEFISKAQTICKKYDVTLTADVFAIVAWQRKIDVHNTGQDIIKISKHLQALHPMIYSSHFVRDFNHRIDVWNEPYNLVYKGTKLAHQFADKSCKIIPYIQANSWQVNYSAEYIYAQIEAIRHSGGHGFILWNSSNKYMHTLRWLKEYKERN